jgi:AcrR family transcriptional regulator
LFHHYKDKEEILYAVIEQGLSGALDTLKKTIKETNSAEENLKAAILRQLKTLHGKDKDAHIVSIIEWSSLDEASRQQLIVIRDEYEAHWQYIIDAAISEGLLQGQPRLQRLFVLGSLNWTIHWYKPKHGVQIEDTADEFYRFITKSG